MNSQIRSDYFIRLLNQIFEIEKKLLLVKESHTIDRNLSKLKDQLSEQGFSFHNPINEDYTDSRTDCEAQILPGPSGNLKIIETIKPIVRFSSEGFTRIVQKAVVIVEGKTTGGSSK